MHRFKELSYKEIAEVLDVSPQTVASPHPAGIEAASCFLKGLLAHAGMAGGLKSISPGVSLVFPSNPSAPSQTPVNKEKAAEGFPPGIPSA